jgi:hypothetical protein
MSRMAERQSRAQTGAADPVLFAPRTQKHHPHLFFKGYLENGATHLSIPPAELERITLALKNWADAFLNGHLNQKETSLDAEFLQKIFGEALNYKSVTESPGDYHREKNPTVAGIGIADGALGWFGTGKPFKPTAIIELKGANVDLDFDKSNGRTAVQQCWDYLNNLPDTQWGILSNYQSVRLYNRAATPRAYEEFTVNDFLDPDRVRQFYYIFEREGLLGSRAAKEPPRTTRLLRQTLNQQREIGDKLYKYYAESREQLIGELMNRKGFTQDDAIRIAQKLLDRVIFMAFCEDRGLLPEKLIESTWKNVAPLARATNPRWNNFIDAFHAIDRGHPSLDLPTGYNGGLFREDPAIDNLNLEDNWTDVFREIGSYDFQEGGEVNVDVLGHIFERSITELEKRRAAGLFGLQAQKALAAMPKSAERKRFGVYYTPPQFTRLIVDETIGKLIADRIVSLPDDHAGLHQRIAALRKLTIVDPACGSGAFLIAAYERLENAYEEVARKLRIGKHLQEALNLTNAYPDYILFDSLYGVDLSAESVEITQLALWIRSARKGRALTDLSNNIRRGNSLIRDPAVHPNALDWKAAFPAIFAKGGFDAVIGNPPWERMKVQEREFFSLAAPEIASSVNAADRRKLVAAVEAANPDLWEKYHAVLAASERTLAYVRTEPAGYPLTGRGDVNTYMLFAELARQLVSPTGRAGLLVPSGIATDATTKHFFNDLMESKTLTALFDFENRKLVFPDVDSRFKFSVLLMNGAEVPPETARFVFFAQEIEDLRKRNRQISLTARDLKLLNPNTRTCPIFRTRRDAELTKRIYRQIPILIDYKREKGGNPWEIRFVRMFDQTNDAERFITAEALATDGFALKGNHWTKGSNIYLPLYEAKMIQAFDHRAAGVRIEAGNWMRQGQTEDTNLVEHQNPEFVAQPRYWVEESAIVPAFSEREWSIAYKDVTSATNQRTMISAFIPRAAVVNSAPLIFSDAAINRQACLLANLNSLAYDFVARQKVGGLHLNFFIVEQLPTLPPDAYDEKCPWDKKRTLESWISERVLKLTCTANDMLPLARAADFAPGVWKWKEPERAQLRAELDAAYFHLYQLDRDDVDYILGTFQGIVDEDGKSAGQGATRRLTVEAFDALTPPERMPT